MEDIGFERIFAGPTRAMLGGQGAVVVRGTGHGGFLIDDNLTSDEADAICGHYDHFIRTFYFHRRFSFPSLM